MIRIAGALAIIAMAVTPALGGSLWKIDPDHAQVGFKVRHLMVSNVKGNFDLVSGTVEIDESDLAKSSVKVKIPTASINTGIAKRDEHLRSADFFDCTRFPDITFISRKVRAVAPGKLQVTGDLTIHGVTKEVLLDVEGPTPAIKDPWGLTRRGASAIAKINRKDFGLTWNKALEAGGVAVGDEISISLEVEMIKQ